MCGGAEVKSNKVDDIDMSDKQGSKRPQPINQAGVFQCKGSKVDVLYVDKTWYYDHRTFQTNIIHLKLTIKMMCYTNFTINYLLVVASFIYKINHIHSYIYHVYAQMICVALLCNQIIWSNSVTICHWFFIKRPLCFQDWKYANML